MRKLISYLIITLLLITSGMPSYAIVQEEISEEEVKIKPIFEGWVDNHDGTYKAYFGYQNESVDAKGDPMDVYLEFGTDDNKVSGYTGGATFPENFIYPDVVPGRPGRTNWYPNALIEIDGWDGSNIVWTLDGRTATASLNDSLEHVIDVSPIFEGWVDNGDGTYNAYFGYENNSETAGGDPLDVYFEFGTDHNKVSGYTGGATFPENFIYPEVIAGRPGRTNWFPDAEIEITGWDGSNIVWTLDGKTATASLSPGLEHKPEIKIKPIFEGWVDNHDGTYKAYFGYQNESVDAYGDPMDVYLEFGTSDNKVTGYTGGATFPENFIYPEVVPGRPGRTDWYPNALIEIDGWDGSNIVWTLDGRTATASLNDSLEHVIDVSPIFEGWVDNGDGTYNAYFGYENNSETAGGDPLDVYFEFGTDHNKVTGYTGGATFPENFIYPEVISGRPGRTNWFPNAEIEITGWDGSNIVWTLDGKTATASLNAGLEHKPEVKIKPIFEGWVDNGDGTYNAYFGYQNESVDAYGDPMDVYFEFGTDHNKVTGYTGGATFPENFVYPEVIAGRPGRTNWFPDAEIEITGWDGSNIVWTLDGKTATASLNAGLEHKPEVKIKPIFEGWVDNGDGTYNAYFGYQNESVDAYGNPMDVYLEFGTGDNKVTGYTGGATFPENFIYPEVVPGRPGRTNWFPDAEIEITGWDGSNIVWKLDGRTATASLNPGLEHVLYPVTFTVGSGSGSINGEVDSVAIASGDMIEEGKNIEFSVSPSAGYSISNWSLNGTFLNSTATSYVYNDLDQALDLEVYFELNEPNEPNEPTEPTPDVNAIADSFTIAQDTSLILETSELLANDVDYDDFDSVQNPMNGTVDLAGDIVTFTPDAGFIGTAYFYYTISDATDTDTTIVTVEVEEGLVIEDEDTPLGSGNPDAFVIIEPEITPLGTIDYTLPYIVGYPDRTFKPEREITRAEMATAFARILQLDLSNPGTPIYPDVTQDDWFYKYVQGVTNIGLFSGYEDGKFKPNRPVTHGEIAAAFSRYWELINVEIPADETPYTDVSGHWAEEMISRMYNAGISVSYLDSTFKPDAFTSRTEMIIMVNRALNRQEMMAEIPSFEDVDPSYWGYGAIEAATQLMETALMK